MNSYRLTLRLRPGIGLLALLLGACAQEDSDPLTSRGIEVSQGAAAGYVADQVCADCHADLYQSYQDVGMARSFYRPRADNLVEDFTAEPFYHQASDRYYRMQRSGEQITFERYQLDAEGKEVNRYEVRVDWILGSGHTSRTYLFRTPGGEMYQLPLAWYSQSQSWGMAPGFDDSDHLGVQRLVRRECMFCHNAYPEVESGSDRYGAAHTFPADLPEGIGCQRCHGPGAEHVQTSLRGDQERVRSTIVNPQRLGWERATDVCYSCHFQPTVALMGVRRYDRPTYSFRPGEPLDDYLAVLDVDEAEQSREQRFEINHHPYRLEQSTCFQESEPGRLSCTWCHDPHRKIAPEQRKAHYRDACLTCHTQEACSLEHMAGASSLQVPGRGQVEIDDCAACHMPRRRTQDVVQVVMTDHRIQRQPGTPELLDPLQERTPILVGAEMLRSNPEISSLHEQLYKASAVTMAGGNEDATRFLYQALPESGVEHAAPYLDLVRGLLTLRRFEQAEQAASEVIQRWPEAEQAWLWRAIARSQLGRPEEALVDLAETLAQHGERPEALFNQGAMLYGLKRYDEALVSLDRATALRPNLERAWIYRGLCLLALERYEEAREALQQSLSIEPKGSAAARHLEAQLQTVTQASRAGQETTPDAGHLGGSSRAGHDAQRPASTAERPATMVDTRASSIPQQPREPAG